MFLNLDEHSITDLALKDNEGGCLTYGNLVAHIIKFYPQLKHLSLIHIYRESDYEIPASMGLHTDYRPNIVYKCKVHTSAKMNNGYAGKQYSTSLDEMFRHGKDYSEYIGIFYVFTKRLYAKRCV